MAAVEAELFASMEEKTACSTLALTWVLEKPASRMTRLTLGSSRMEMMSCSISTLAASGGGGGGWPAPSTAPRRWCACARLNAATSALDSTGAWCPPRPAVVVVEHDGGGGGEAVERDVEAELEGLALERVGVGAEAGGAEEPRRREHGAGDVERGHLRVAAPPGQGHGLPHHGRRLRRQRLLHGAAAGAHLLSLLAEISSLQFASNVRAQRVSGSLDPLATCDDPF